jgi:hypothetical protein
MAAAPEHGRPCLCDNAPRDGRPYVRGVHCAKCWLWHNNPASRAAWTGAFTPAPAVRFVPCRWEGAVAEPAACHCEAKHVRVCHHPEHGAAIDLCTRGPLRGSAYQSCSSCRYKEAPEPGSS